MARVKKCIQNKIQLFSTGIRISYMGKLQTEKSIPMVTVQHHGACRVMQNSYLEEWIFLSAPNIHNNFFFFFFFFHIF